MATTAHYVGLALSINGVLSYMFSGRLGGVSASGAATASHLYSPCGGVRSQSGILSTTMALRTNAPDPEW